MVTTLQSEQDKKFYLDFFELEEREEVRKFELEQQDKAVLETQHNTDIEEVGFETETIEDTMNKRIVICITPKTPK